MQPLSRRGERVGEDAGGASLEGDAAEGRLGHAGQRALSGLPRYSDEGNLQKWGCWSSVSPPEVKLKKHLQPVLQGGVAAAAWGNRSRWGKADGSKDGFVEG